MASATDIRPARETAPPSPASRERPEGWFSRQRALTTILALVTVVAVYVCARIAAPFVPALAWALAIAIVTHPLHRRIAAHVPFPNVAAALAVAIVAIAIVAPSVYVARTLVVEAAAGFHRLREIGPQRWEGVIDRNPRLAPSLRWIEDRTRAQIGGAADAIGARASDFVAGGAWALAQVAITLFFLFFFFRDRRAAIDRLSAFLPVSGDEAEILLDRVARTIRATVSGSLTVALVQGALGGFMFWLLGLPAPLVWGSIMALFAVVPMLGTFVIWFPTAVFLLLEGDWVRALVLTVWGSTAIGLIDNVLYPVVVGRDLDLHTVPVFISLVGGIALFGVSGVILGPVILAVTLGLLDVWRRRTRGGRAAETAV